MKPKKLCRRWYKNLRIPLVSCRPQSGGGGGRAGGPHHSWRNPLARLQLSSMADVLICSLAAFHLGWGDV